MNGPARMCLAFVAVVSAGLVAAAPATAAQLRWPCEPQPVHIDPAFSSWQRRTIEEALADFERATFRKWPVTDDSAAPVRFEHDDPNRYYWGAGAVALLAHNGSQWVEARVVVSPLTPRDTFRATVLHELGHVAGLRHDDDPDNVMSTWGRVPERYTPLDLARLAATARHCRRIGA